MSEFSIELFWDEYLEHSGERQTNVALRKLLRNYRQSLGSNSKTANAIDRHLPLEEIIVRAREEEHFEFAETVYFAKNHVG